MWWSETSEGSGRFMRIAAAMALAALTAGCFQPLYGTASLGAAASGPGLRDALAGVDVFQIEAPKATDESRIAVELRNSLLYDLTGGGNPAPSTHRLKVNIASTRATVIVDIASQRPDIENYGINAS